MSTPATELGHHGKGTDPFGGRVGGAKSLGSGRPGAPRSGVDSARFFRSGSPRDTNVAEAVRRSSCSF